MFSLSAFLPFIHALRFTSYVFTILIVQLFPVDTQTIVTWIAAEYWTSRYNNICSVRQRTHFASDTNELPNSFQLRHLSVTIVCPACEHCIRRH